MESVAMTPFCWSGRRVLVTGHTGFKGGWLTLRLVSLGADVCGYALAPGTRPSLFDAACVGDVCRSEIGDIRDRTRLQSVIDDFRPEVVFHLAAQALVRASYRDPVETYSTNVMGLITLFEAVRSAPSARCVVNVTSDKCYENREWVWGYRETDPMGGFDPYSSSKGCAELVTACWRRSFFAPAGVRLASGRAGNVIGGGDWAPDRLAPDFIRAMAEGTELVIRSPHAIRPWQHVLEPLSGYMLLAQKLLESEDDGAADAWNFGPDGESVRDVEWVARTLCDLWGDGARMRVAPDASLHEARELRLETSKARAGLNWRPRWRAAEALERVVRWHKAFNAGEDARALCARDIDDYDKSCADVRRGDVI
jgi:CDP-glucose 4,6-dehydratase